MTDLLDLTVELLTRRGALVEKGDGLCEVLLPGELVNILEIPEHAKFLLSGESNGGFLLSRDSQLFTNMGKLLNGSGTYTVAKFPSPFVNIGKIQEKISGKVVFNNAVFALKETEQKTIPYLLAYYKYTAFSDEQQAGILASMINMLNLSVREIDAGDLSFLTEAGEEPFSWEEIKQDRVIQCLCRAQRSCVQEELIDFVGSLERRLKRDIARVQEYYGTLIREGTQKLKKTGVSEQDRTKILSKIDAIETDLKRKVQDLVAKYSLSIEINPIAFIQLEVLVQVFWILIKRRKAERLFPLTYNPVLKSLDPLPCEACFHAGKSYFVCDEKQHILCGHCFAFCARCEKNYCRACHEKACPKCGSPDSRCIAQGYVLRQEADAHV